MDSNLVSAIAAVLASISLIITAYLGLKKLKTDINQGDAITKKIENETEKTDNEASDVISKAALALLEPYKTQNEDLKRQLIAEKESNIQYQNKMQTIVDNLTTRIEKAELEIKTLKGERNAVVNGAYMLFHQVRSLNGIPVYVPPEYKGT
jgi:uncharacterized protein (DUF3084 family)